MGSGSVVHSKTAENPGVRFSGSFSGLTQKNHGVKKNHGVRLCAKIRAYYIVGENPTE